MICYGATYGLNLDIVGGSLDNIQQTVDYIATIIWDFGRLDVGVYPNENAVISEFWHSVPQGRGFEPCHPTDSFDETKEAVKLNLETRKVA